MLDDLNTELENADSKLDSTLKKVAKVLHMNNGEFSTNFYCVSICLNVDRCIARYSSSAYTYETNGVHMWLF